MEPRLAAILVSLCGLLGAPAWSQPATKSHTIGFLSYTPLPNISYQAFREGLNDLKYIEGRNLTLVTRSAEASLDRLPAAAAELVAAKVDVLVTNTGTAALAAKKASSTIPIVMLGSADAVRMGIVESLARPGGNVTGFTTNSPDLAAKRLELLGLMPGLRRVATVWCPTAPISHEELKLTTAAAKTLGIVIAPVEFRYGSTPWSALETKLNESRPDALFLLDCTNLPFGQLLDYATNRRLPSMTPYVVLAERGALLAYGPDTRVTARRAAVYVDKILRGARPADLPVEQPTAFDFVINERVAKAAGLKLPNSILVRATRVIN